MKFYMHSKNCIPKAFMQSVTVGNRVIGSFYPFHDAAKYKRNEDQSIRLVLNNLQVASVFILF